MTGDGPASEVLPYATPAAFRAALNARFRAIAKEGEYTLQQLGRQFAYDRLLARIFSGADAELWVLKGGGALLVRLDGARHSLDLDLYRAEQDLAGAEQALRDAAATGLGDFFGFTIGPATPLIDITKGVRLSIQATIGRPFERFSVDLIGNVAMTGTPDLAAPILAASMPGLRTPPYRLYPIADHVADKVCAIIELHSGADGIMRASTRIKDLVDLVTVAATQRVDAAALSVALQSETARRSIPLATGFDVPDHASWGPGYVKLAGSVRALVESDAGGANGSLVIFSVGLSLARAFVDPVLSQGRWSGWWDPETLSWSDR
jgi:hypothetical protein